MELEGLCDLIQKEGHLDVEQVIFIYFYYFFFSPLKKSQWPFLGLRTFLH